MKTNKCIDCDKIISKNAIRCNPCAHKDSNNSNYKKGLPKCQKCEKTLSRYDVKHCITCYDKKEYLCPDCGKSISRRANKCLSCAQKGHKRSIESRGKQGESIQGKLHWNYKEGKTHNNKCKDCGKIISFNAERCKSCSRISNSNPNWKNGISKYPYAFGFNIELKLEIRERDDFICQECGMTEEEHIIVYGTVLCVHHIDYDKTNFKKENLISLYFQCNSRANFNRDYWEEYYKEVILNVRKK